MATTTNYGWTTPDDTALVKDGAAAIRTLGSSIDTTTKNLNPETTLGDIAYRSSTANVKTRLALGTANQQLRVNAGATAPEWFTPAGSGKVLQVVNALLSTTAASTSGSYADTGLTATITPSSATSKVLVLVNVVGLQGAGASTYGSLRLVKDSTALITFEDRFGFIDGANNSNHIGGSGCNYLDSPATTAATTYKVQFLRGAGSGTVRVSNDACTSTITLLEIGA